MVSSHKEVTVPTVALGKSCNKSCQMQPKQMFNKLELSSQKLDQEKGLNGELPFGLPKLDPAQFAAADKHSAQINHSLVGDFSIVKYVLAEHQQK